MMKTGIRKAFGLAMVTSAILAVSTTSGASRIGPMSFNASKVVQVNVRYNMTVPLADTKDATLVATQESGRKLFYRLASKECTILKEMIAKTCRITNINVSTQIRPPSGNNPMSLHLSGNARYAIDLKTDGDKPPKR